MKSTIPFVLVNYNFTPTWIKEYTDDYLIYDRSDSKEYLKDFDQSKIIYTDNIGNVDRDKLAFLAGYYDTLPEVFLWGKTNLFKYVTRETLDAALEALVYQPLLKQDHQIYSDRMGQVNYYQDGMYHERADDWYFGVHAASPFSSWRQWAMEFGLPIARYVPFPPGGNFVLTKEKVHLYGQHTYEKMRDLMDYCQLPVEAQCAERSYHLLWNP